MVYQTNHYLSEDVTTMKTTKTMHVEMMWRDVVYSLVEDKVDDNVDVRDNSDICVQIRGGESSLLLRSCDYYNEWNLIYERIYLDSRNILYTICFDSVHERNRKRNKWLTRNRYPVSTVNKYGCCRFSFTCNFNGYQRHESMRFEPIWCKYFGY